MKKTGIYKASNVTFNPKTLDAHSYKWWRFVAVVEGLVVFNSYRYSVSTSKHQSKVRRIMEQLGIRTDLAMPLPRGIRHDQTLAEMIQESEEYLCDAILNNELKRDLRNERARENRAQAKALIALIRSASHESQSAHMSVVQGE